ncbi:MAG TPA: DUF1573 domain-containing protein [Chloroflexi bacterium]|nr:DUF1573 domain-containing protein [Chloroflexota bacterium]
MGVRKGNLFIRAGGGVFVVALLMIGLWAFIARPVSGAGGYRPGEVEYGQPLSSTQPGGVESGVLVVSYPFDGPQPHLELPVYFSDAGRVKVGGQAHYTFVVRNTGNGPLIIRRLYPTCAYLRAELTASVIPPGRVALLTVTLDPAQYPGELPVRIRRGVIIQSNDPRSPESEVWVQAMIVP